MCPKKLGDKAKSADPDQTAPQQSDLGLHCLPMHIQVFTINMELFAFSH